LEADYDFWVRVATLEPKEAAMLLIGIDIRKVIYSKDPYRPKMILPDQVQERYNNPCR
jgi:hypothetical protein